MKSLPVKLHRIRILMILDMNILRWSRFCAKTGIDSMKKVVESQPKNVIRQVRLLFFSDIDTAKYFRIVFGYSF
jgi:hypothetical protein